MKSQRPYLLRALYEWVVDSESTPYLLVNVHSEDVQVPMDFVNNGQIVLNISPAAVRDLLIDNERVVFDGRFGGRAFTVSIPVEAVVAIYARENGQGMMFDDASDGVDLETVDDNATDAAASQASASDRHSHDVTGAQMDGATDSQSGAEPKAGTQSKSGNSSRSSHLRVIK